MIDGEKYLHQTISMLRDDQLGPEITRKLYALGDYIFKEGDLGCEFYIVEKGQVEIFTRDTDSKAIRLTVVNPGESFGEFALLDSKPRSASARAMVDSSIIRVSEKGYEQMVSELPPWAIMMMRSFIERLRQMNKQVVQKQFVNASSTPMAPKK